MNRQSSLPVLSLALLALASGCSSSTTKNPVDVQEASSSLSRDTSPSVPAADMTSLVAGNSSFAVNAYKAIGASNATGNVFFSPYSISSALAMTYAGAGGATGTEMASAMHYTLPGAQLHPAFDGLDLQLASRAQTQTADNKKPVQLHIANSLWGYEKESFGKPFLDTLAVNYGAGIKLVDFVSNPDACRGQINDWVSSETNQKIQNLLGQGSIDQSTRLVLVDAIYFDGNWASSFDPTSTQPASFTKLDGSAASVSMMHNSEFEGSFAKTATYDAIELPYAGNQIAMDIVMPKAGSFATFESQLSADSLASVFSSMKSGPVVLSVPKFKIAGDSVSLKPMLNGMGMKIAFTDQADFSAIAIDPAGPLFIADVLHKAYINVDENGTEAAAATAVIVGVGTAAPVDPPATITVDHAFFFVLRDVPTGAILFAGRVGDPTAN